VRAGVFMDGIVVIHDGERPSVAADCERRDNPVLAVRAAR